MKLILQNNVTLMLGVSWDIPNNSTAHTRSRKKKSVLVFLKTQKLLVPVSIPERENRGKNIAGLCPSIWEKHVPVYECWSLGHCTTSELRRLRAP